MSTLRLSFSVLTTSRKYLFVPCSNNDSFKNFFEALSPLKFSASVRILLLVSYISRTTLSCDSALENLLSSFALSTTFRENITRSSSVILSVLNSKSLSKSISDNSPNVVSTSSFATFTFAPNKPLINCLIAANNLFMKLWKPSVSSSLLILFNALNCIAYARTSSLNRSEFSSSSG